MNEHTPGPWLITEPRSTSREIVADVYSRKMAKWRAENPGNRGHYFKGVDICTINVNWNGGGNVFGPTDGLIDMGEINANANLIAAAPELLNACRMLFRGLDATWIETAEGRVVTEVACAAIAKAEGES